MHQLVFSHLAKHGLQGEQKERNHLEFLFLTFQIGDQPLSQNHCTSYCLTVLVWSNSLWMARKDTKKEMELEAEARLPTD